jgi:hypothetical protein
MIFCKFKDDKKEDRHAFLTSLGSSWGYGIVFLFFFAAPVNGLVSTIYVAHFHLTFPEETTIGMIILVIFQAVLRYLNLLFFLINSYLGEPGKLKICGIDPE